MPRSFSEKLSASTRTRRRQPRQIARAGSRPHWQYPVLNEKQGDLVLCGGKLLHEIAAEARVVRVERVARFDQ
jgi:hypothetical protein